MMGHPNMKENVALTWVREPQICYFWLYAYCTGCIECTGLHAAVY